VKPLSALYGAAVRIRNDFYDRGMLTVNRLVGPVVSIGNLTVGGSGKTPFLILLGELLQQRGIAFDVLSRGYRRTTRGVAIVDPNGMAFEFGDEPLLIARKLEVHVIVGEDRRQAGETAEATFGPQLHLLDDGFQHRRLARDFDIVLITPTDAPDSLLPSGRLREPIASLSRADAVVLTNDTPTDGLQLQKQLVWHMRRDIVPPETLEPWFAFCGIARPQNFFTQLEAAQVVLAGTRAFRDHHRYTDDDVRELQRLRQQAGAPGFVTTEKDAVNLGAHLQALQPIHAVRVRMQLENANAALDAMLAAIERKRHTT
jgi:tetraacyldisaccharide 4'-kinase